MVSILESFLSDSQETNAVRVVHTPTSRLTSYHQHYASLNKTQKLNLVLETARAVFRVVHNG
jgi:hypothetical protein